VARTLLPVFLVAVLGAGLWAWSRGLNGPYHFDDHITPLDDPASQSLSAWQHHLPRTLRPITKLTYALEAETVITSTPAARRVLSIALHGVSAGLLLLLFRRLTPGAPPFLSAALAAVWFLHPVHADAVLLASGRSAALSTLLIFAALVAFDRSRPWAAALLFALAGLARETALAALLPLMLLSLARNLARPRVAVRELLPLAMAGGLVIWWVSTTPRYLQLAEYSLLGRPFAHSVVAQISAVPVGLWLLIRPSALSIDYGIPLPLRPWDPLFVVGVLLYLAAAAGMLLCVRRSQAAAAVGLALWLAALLPTQSLVPKLDALTNRPLSLALAGLLLAAPPLIGAALSTLSASLPAPSRWSVARRWPAIGACAGAALLVMLLTSATADRAELFQSELRLWQDAAAKSRANERPHVQVALLLKDLGRVREAGEALSVAGRINPFSLQVEALSRVLPTREVVP
jgi:hypothetical protein